MTATVSADRLHAVARQLAIIGLTPGADRLFDGYEIREAMTAKHMPDDIVCDVLNVLVVNDLIRAGTFE